MRRRELEPSVRRAQMSLQLFGLQEGASYELVKNAYRRLAMQTHPDKGGDPEAFKQVKLVYDYLTKNGTNIPKPTPPPIQFAIRTTQPIQWAYYGGNATTNVTINFV